MPHLGLTPLRSRLPRAHKPRNTPRYTHNKYCNDYLTHTKILSNLSVLHGENSPQSETYSTILNTTTDIITYSENTINPIQKPPRRRERIQNMHRENLSKSCNAHEFA